MATARFNLTGSIGGASADLEPKAEEDGTITQEGTLNAGHDGTVFSGGGTGTTVFDFDTADEEDNYAEGDYVALYWGTTNYLTDCIITNVDTVDHRVTFTDGGGGGTPANTTVCRIVKQTAFSLDFTGSEVVAFAVLIPTGLTRGSLSFWDSGVEDTHRVLVAAVPFWWVEDMGFANPMITYTPDEISFSTYDAVGTERVKFALVQNNLIVN